MSLKNLRLSLLVLVLFIFLPGCSQNSSPASSEGETKKPVAVKVSKVEKRTVESIASLNGKVKPIEEVNITPKTPGKVQNIYFDVGHPVKKGSILFTLEDKDSRLQVSQAQASLMAAKASLSKSKGGLMEQQLAQLKNALVSAKINFENAKLDYERTKQLYEVGGVSKQVLEAAESKYTLSEEQYSLAKTNYGLTKSRINPESIAAAEAQVQQAQAAYDIAKSQLDNTKISSPIDGIVASKNIKVGELVSSSMPAMNIVNLDSVVVEVGVTEEIINKIKTSETVRVDVKSASDKTLKGRIISIAPSADPKTQSYLVKVKVPNSEHLLKGGMFAEVRLSVDKSENVLAVPLNSIIDDAGKKVVYVVEGEKAKRKEVILGFISEHYAEVKEGLAENEVLVIKGQNFLQDGSGIIISDK